MPNQSGIWTLSQQFQGRGQGLWPVKPGAPTIGTATAGGSLCASVAFTAPACAGYPATISSYTVTSTPGCLTGTGASSPVTVSGLTFGTSYTFKVRAQNASGLTGACSGSSNSITATIKGQVAYTTAGTYSWVAPTGVTSVSVVTVGGGGGGDMISGGGGGALAYANNITVTPGNSYAVVVGAAGGVGGPGGASSFNSTSAKAGGGSNGGTAGTVINGTGGSGGTGTTYSGGGGAGGYAGAGGNSPTWNTGQAGSGGAGGGGGGGYIHCPTLCGGGGGGGVGLLGQGASGGTAAVSRSGQAGSGGSNGGCAFGSKNGAAGGAYGGGGGAGGWRNCAVCRGCGAAGAVGAVRIIWPGTTRSFPSTCTGNL